MRAKRQIDEALACDEGLIVFLRPLDPEVTEGVDFRVFVPPPLKADNDFKDRQIMLVVAENAVKSALQVVPVIAAAAKAGGTFDGLRLHGFTMDVVVKKGAPEAQLVEINPFDAMSPCGSCLFHWLENCNQLYGLEDKIVVHLSEESR
ncbi:uncharacterized protein LTR77_003494 [Saxophila tyrrhenica]|uniref:Inositol-1,3,4-trisphosphate 5/6-kinase n=1 Tax=Saxophila tyrrhenica TaxID=1690608 RepID=A0AAV9PDX3_9PEZI|nr:hypothetical protein LTR77_003494 [Saxophila tyrrhenica]